MFLSLLAVTLTRNILLTMTKKKLTDRPHIRMPVSPFDRTKQSPFQR